MIDSLGWYNPCPIFFCYPFNLYDLCAQVPPLWADFVFVTIQICNSYTTIKNEYFPVKKAIKNEIGQESVYIFLH